MALFKHRVHGDAHAYWAWPNKTVFMIPPRIHFHWKHNTRGVNGEEDLGLGRIDGHPQATREPPSRIVSTSGPATDQYVCYVLCMELMHNWHVDLCKSREPNNMHAEFGRNNWIPSITWHGDFSSSLVTHYVHERFYDYTWDPWIIDIWTSVHHVKPTNNRRVDLCGIHTYGMCGTSCWLRRGFQWNKWSLSAHWHVANPKQVSCHAICFGISRGRPHVFEK